MKLHVQFFFFDKNGVAYESTHDDDDDDDDDDDADK